MLYTRGYLLHYATIIIRISEIKIINFLDLIDPNIAKTIQTHIQWLLHSTARLVYLKNFQNLFQFDPEHIYRWQIVGQYKTHQTRNAKI